jgi:hypothetical protein
LLTVVNNAPVVLARHRIEVSLAQKTLIVRLHQLVNGVWITAELGVVNLDRARVLLSAVDRFLFLIPPDRIGNLRRRDRQRNRDQQDQEKHAEQQKPLFLPRSGLHPFRFGDSSHHWRSGNVCVL